MSNGSRLRIVPSLGDLRRRLGAGLDLDELVADQPVVLDRRRPNPAESAAARSLRTRILTRKRPDGPAGTLISSTSPASMPATRTLAPVSSAGDLLNSA